MNRFSSIEGFDTENTSAYSAYNLGKPVGNAADDMYSSIQTNGVSNSLLNLKNNAAQNLDKWYHGLKKDVITDSRTLDTKVKNDWNNLTGTYATNNPNNILQKNSAANIVASPILNPILNPIMNPILSPTANLTTSPFYNYAVDTQNHPVCGQPSQTDYNIIVFLVLLVVIFLAWKLFFSKN